MMMAISYFRQCTFFGDVVVAAAAAAPLSAQHTNTHTADDGYFRSMSFIRFRRRFLLTLHVYCCHCHITHTQRVCFASVCIFHWCVGVRVSVLLRIISFLSANGSHVSRRHTLLLLMINWWIIFLGAFFSFGARFLFLFGALSVFCAHNYLYIYSNRGTAKCFWHDCHCLRQWWNERRRWAGEKWEMRNWKKIENLYIIIRRNRIYKIMKYKLNAGNEIWIVKTKQ